MAACSAESLPHIARLEKLIRARYCESFAVCDKSIRKIVRRTVQTIQKIFHAEFDFILNPC